MKRIPAIGVALLVCAAVLAPGDMRAQVRGAPTQKRVESVQQQPISTEERARQVAELEAWLRRLPGKYRTVHTRLEVPVLEHCVPVYNLIGGDCAFPNAIFRTRQAEPTKGLAECEDFAAGPGVICRFSIDKSSPWTALFGLDPDTPEIRVLYAGGLWYFVAPGSLRGDTVTFHTGGCPWTVPERRDRSNCVPIYLFRAKPDGKGFEILRQPLRGGFGHLTELHRIEGPDG